MHNTCVRHGQRNKSRFVRTARSASTLRSSAPMPLAAMPALTQMSRDFLRTDGPPPEAQCKRRTMTKYISSALCITAAILLFLWPMNLLASDRSQPLPLAPSPDPSVANTVTFLNAFPLPTCESQYSVPSVTTVSGGRIDRPHGKLYCFPDAKSQDRLIGILTLADFPFASITEVHISATYITSLAFAGALCNLGIPESALLTLYVQNSTGPAARPTQKPHFRASILSTLKPCFSQVHLRLLGCDVFPDASHCPRKVTNSHHIKALFLLSPEKSLTLLGSGNITDESLRYNIEDWVGYVETGTRDSATTCIFQYLDGLHSNPDLRFDEQEHLYRSCLAQTRNFPANVDHVILPFDRKNFVQRLTDLFHNSDRIVIICQLLESQRIISLIRQAKHADITIILDDAYYYGARNLYSQNFVDIENATAVLNLNKMKHVTLRFLQTNHHYEVHNFTNTVHLRTVFLKTGVYTPRW